MEVTLRGYVPTEWQLIGMTIAVAGSVMMAIDITQIRQLC